MKSGLSATSASFRSTTRAPPVASSCARQIPRRTGAVGRVDDDAGVEARVHVTSRRFPPACSAALIGSSADRAAGRDSVPGEQPGRALTVGARDGTDQGV